MSEAAQSSTPQTAATAALASLEHLGIQPEPQRLAVFYGYHLGRDPALRAALDAALQSGHMVTPAVLDEMHRVFLLGDPSAEAGPKLEMAAADLSALAGRAGLQVASFGRVLGDAADRLGALGGADLRRLAAGLLALTQHLTGQTAEVSARLAETERGIAALRQELSARTRAALTDPLTGIGNRRAFDADLAALLANQRPETGPLALLLLDLDHFKLVNDTWGHPVGDAVLRFVGARLRETLRADDRAARYGGEEFALLLPGTPAEGAMAVAERLRLEVAGHDFVLRVTGKRIGRVTLSCGVAVHAPGEPAEALVARADTALYAAKTGGRNRAVLARPPAAPT